MLRAALGLVLRLLSGPKKHPQDVHRVCIAIALISQEK